MRTLNLGCGKDLWGTDRLDMYPTSATTKVWDLNKKLPFKNETFDAVKAEQVLEHIKNIGLFADEVYRVLKKGGQAYIRTDYAGYLLFYTSKIREHNFCLNQLYSDDSFGHGKGEDVHYHLFVPSHLRALFKKFKKIEITYYIGGRNKFLRFLKRLMPFKLGASQLDVRLVK